MIEMTEEEILCSLVGQTDSTLVMVVIDGIGGLPVRGKTELEAAKIPNLDQLASKSSCGLIDPISYGITPGSGPSHLALFGYDPFHYEIGRGVMEALGIGLKMTKNDLAARANLQPSMNRGGSLTGEPGESRRKRTKRSVDFSRIRFAGLKEFRFQSILGGNIGSSFCSRGRG
jgi:2,3-bisphosphoglycerate-independent phosphoglycerate mutase